MVPEDGDEMAHPNIFEMNGGASNSVSLKSFRGAFPMKGDYHFRFLTSINIESGKGITVWMDCSDEDAPVPLQNGGIFAKVSRIRANIPSSSAAPSVTFSNNAAQGSERRNSEKLINFDSDQKPAQINTSVSSGAPENDLLGLSSTNSPSSSSSSSSTQPTPVSVFSTGKHMYLYCL